MCSHWPHKLTWRAFFCTVIAAFTFTALMNSDLGSGLSPGGSVVRDALVLNIDSSDGTHTWGYVDFVWAALLGALGGLLGAGYIWGTIRLAAVRRRWAQDRGLRLLEVLHAPYALLQSLTPCYTPLAPCYDPPLTPCNDPPRPRYDPPGPLLHPPYPLLGAAALVPLLRRRLLPPARLPLHALLRRHVVLRRLLLRLLLLLLLLLL